MSQQGNIYSIVAVLETGATSRTVGWSWSGSNSGTLCWQTWTTLRATMRTSSGEAVVGGWLVRNGAAVDTLTNEGTVGPACVDAT